MALNYIYRKYKDTYTLENTGLVTLDYTLSYKECSSVTTVSQGKINVNQTVTLPITYIDGVYNIKISDSVSEEILPDILFYKNLILSIVDNVENVICGCENCKDCGGNCSDDECNSLLVTLVSEQALTFVNNPKYNTYLSIIGDYLKCSISELVLASLTQEMILGKQEVKDLVLQIIGLYYLAFYYTELHEASDDSEVDYVKDKYKFNKIAKCLKKIGINTGDIEDQLFNYPVFYWQLSDPISDIEDVIPLLTDVYLATKPTDRFQVFTQGKIISYSQIGRIVFTIKNADSANFTLNDSLGNDITDQFDTYYDSVNKYALFVSKIPYSYGNVYFKFKLTNN